MRPFRLLTAALLFQLAACTASPGTDALLAAPAVGDFYVAQLDAFSAFPFHDEHGQPIVPAFGLMRVVAADGTGIVVITEESAVSAPRHARSRLRGDLDAIVFDEAEQIELPMAALQPHHADGTILAARRPEHARRD